MYNSVQLAKRYLHYYLTAFNGKGHGMHSPFVFDFILNVLNNKAGYIPPPSIDFLHKELMKEKQMIHVEDLGAGTRSHAAEERSVGQIARSAVKPKKYAQLLYRLAAHYKPATTVELGTSLGISTAYFAAANPASKVITIEGSREISRLANTNFEKLGLNNIRQLTGNFDNVLPAVLRPLQFIDLAYIDGNHRYQPTMAYFEQLISRSHNDTILVFDDIHWSAGMEKAWSEIKRNPAVRTTLDIFYLGFVFFRKEFKEKQDFMIRF